MQKSIYDIEIEKKPKSIYDIKIENKKSIYEIPLPSQWGEDIGDIYTAGATGRPVKKDYFDEALQKSRAEYAEKRKQSRPPSELGLPPIPIEQRATGELETPFIDPPVDIPMAAYSTGKMMYKAGKRGLDLAKNIGKDTLGAITGGVSDIAGGVSQAAIKKAPKIKPSEEYVDAFQKWVNDRRSTKMEGYFNRDKFKYLDKEGMKAIHKVQAGEEGYEDVRKYFNDIHNELQSKGIDVGYEENYIPQLWEQPDKATEIFSKKLGLHPSFSFERVVKDYKEGIAKGLKPKFTKISELAQWYEQRAKKAIADREFFDYLKQEGFIEQVTDAPHDWVTLNPDRFPSQYQEYMDKDGFIVKRKEIFKASPEVAEKINNYLGDGMLAKPAKYASSIKNIVLSAGVPKTGINIHGVNILTRHVIAGKNPVKNFIQGTAYLLNPKYAEKAFKKHSNKAIEALKDGLIMTTEEHSLMPIEIEKSNNWAIEGFRKMRHFHEENFEKPLFNQIIPTLKMEHYQVIKKDLMKSMSAKKAGKQAATTVNNLFGGINIEELGRNKTTTNVLRSLVLAPDWAETQLKLGAGIVKALKNPRHPKGKAYRRVVRNLFGAYASLNITNKLINGHFSFENDPGHEFEIEIGKDAYGKKRYIRPFGTAIDFFRLPVQSITAIAKGDLSPLGRIFRNRASIPAGVGLGLAFNVDPFGNPITGKNRYGHPMTVGQQLGSIGSEVSKLFSPQYVGASINYLAGKSGEEQAFAQAFELPMRYSWPKKKRRRRSIEGERKYSRRER